MILSYTFQGAARWNSCKGTESKQKPSSNEHRQVLIAAAKHIWVLEITWQDFAREMTSTFLLRACNLSANGRLPFRMLHNWNHGLQCSGRICWNMLKLSLKLVEGPIPELHWSFFQNVRSCHYMIIRCCWMTKMQILNWNILKPSHNNRNIRTCIWTHVTKWLCCPLGCV